MEEDADYQNIDDLRAASEVSSERNPAVLKPADGDQATNSALGRRFLPILYTISSLSVLLSTLTLVTTIILLTERYENLTRTLSGLQDYIAESYENMNSTLNRLQDNTKRNWTDAQLFCESKDAHLVVINNAEEQAFVGSNLSDSYWIGLKCTYRGGTSHWSWLDGTNYKCSENCSSSGVPCDPCNGDICMKHCAVMTSDGCWNATLCNVSMNWVCEKSAQWCHS